MERNPYPSDLTDEQWKLIEPLIRLRLIWADAGYCGEFLNWAKQQFNRVVEVVKRSDTH